MMSLGKTICLPPSLDDPLDACARYAAPLTQPNVPHSGLWAPADPPVAYAKAARSCTSEAKPACSLQRPRLGSGSGGTDELLHAVRTGGIKLTPPTVG